MIGPPLDPIDRRGGEDLGLGQGETARHGRTDRCQREVVRRFDANDHVASDLDRRGPFDRRGRDDRSPVGLELEGLVDDGRAIPAEVLGHGPHRDPHSSRARHGGKGQDDRPRAVRPGRTGRVPGLMDLSPRGQQVHGHALQVAVGPANGVGVGRALGRSQGVGRIEREAWRQIVPREEVDPDERGQRVPGRIRDGIEHDLVFGLDQERNRRIEGDGPAVRLDGRSDRDRP